MVEGPLSGSKIQRFPPGSQGLELGPLRLGMPSAGRWPEEFCSELIVVSLQIGIPAAEAEGEDVGPARLTAGGKPLAAPVSAEDPVGWKSEPVDISVEEYL